MLFFGQFNLTRFIESKIDWSAFIGTFSIFQNLAIDLERLFRVAQFVNQNLFVIKTVPDPCRCFRPVGNGNHRRRNGLSCLLPILLCFQPVFSQQVIGIGNQVGQRFCLLCLAVDIVLNIRVHVNMIKTGFQLPGPFAVIPDNNPRCFNQPGFNGVVQAKIADNPSIQRFFFRLFT